MKAVNFTHRDRTGRAQSVGCFERIRLWRLPCCRLSSPGQPSCQAAGEKGEGGLIKDEITRGFSLSRHLSLSLPHSFSLSLSLSPSLPPSISLPLTAFPSAVSRPKAITSTSFSFSSSRSRPSTQEHPSVSAVLYNLLAAHGVSLVLLL